MYRLVCSDTIYQRSYFQTSEIVYVQYVPKQVLRSILKAENDNLPIHKWVIYRRHALCLIIENECLV